MTPSQFPGDTLQPIPGISGGESEYTLWQKICQNLYNIVNGGGGGGSGITQLTGDVTAGPGSGSQAATVVNIKGAVPAYALPQTLADGATVAFDVSLGVNASWTIAGNNTLANPTNLYPGASGNIWITQGAGGSHLIAFGGNWKFPGGTAPTPSTAAGAKDLLSWATEDGVLVDAVLNNGLA